MRREVGHVHGFSPNGRDHDSLSLGAQFLSIGILIITSPVIFPFLLIQFPVVVRVLWLTNLSSSTTTLREDNKSVLGEEDS